MFVLKIHIDITAAATIQTGRTHTEGSGREKKKCSQVFSLWMITESLLYVPAMFLLHGRDSHWLSADRSACSFSPALCWTGLAAHGEGRRHSSFLLFQRDSGGQVPFPGSFSEEASIYHHANLHILHGSSCLALGQGLERMRGYKELKGPGGGLKRRQPGKIVDERGSVAYAWI